MRKLYLEQLSKFHSIHLLRNDVAKGYTFAANQGMRASNSSLLVLLNSDTIVTENWIDKMVQCIKSDNKIGIVGPLSNTASWQSVPDTIVNNDWAENMLPHDISINVMGKIVTKYSAHIFPRIKFLNGFCLLIKRELIDEIGYFDEESFGRGYGEENDFCLRTISAGWDLAVADDTYIFHAQSKSYSNEKRKALCEIADKALVNKHGQQIITEGVKQCRNSRELIGIRNRIRAALNRENLISTSISLWEGKRVLFILPVIEPGGGGNIVVEEVKAMIRMGVDARILNLKQHENHFKTSYPNLNVPVIYSEIDNIENIAMNFDAVIATANHTVYWLKDIKQKNGYPIMGYYIQDFEPLFYEFGSDAFKIAMESYTKIPGLVRFTKTKWNQATVKKETGADSTVIGPSVNIDLFRQRIRNVNQFSQDYVYISAMIRPSTPRRNAGFTMKILKKISEENKGKVKIMIFGCDEEQIIQHELQNDFDYKNAGMLNSYQIANLLNETDIFVDFSKFQAMGLTALEAMSCGAAVIVPQNGGTDSFAKNNENSLIVDSTSFEDCHNALQNLIDDSSLRDRLKMNAVEDTCKYTSENVAYNILMALFHNNNIK